MKRLVPILAFVVVAVAVAGCGTTGQYTLLGTGIGAAAGAAGGALVGGAPGAKVGAVVGGGLGGLFGYSRGAEIERQEAAAAYAAAAAQAAAAGTTTCTRQERYVGGKLVVDSVDCHSSTQRAGFRGDPLPAGPAVPQVIYDPGAVRQEPYSQPAAPTVPSAAAKMPTVPPSATAPPPPMVQPQYAPYYGPRAIPGPQYGSWWQRHHQGGFGGFRSWGM